MLVSLRSSGSAGWGKHPESLPHPSHCERQFPQAVSRPLAPNRVPCAGEPFGCTQQVGTGRAGSRRYHEFGANRATHASEARRSNPPLALDHECRCPIDQARRWPSQVYGARDYDNRTGDRSRWVLPERPSDAVPGGTAGTAMLPCSRNVSKGKETVGVVPLGLHHRVTCTAAHCLKGSRHIPRQTFPPCLVPVMPG